ncbi:MAG: helix-turn-helix domain-containing protein, partial [Clostridia bacterium]|nr:helix-turn-helix domain-containing protein [Clostridia bacterium]
MGRSLPRSSITVRKPEGETDMKEHRAFQYRIYPTNEQIDLIERTFGCCR